MDQKLFENVSQAERLQLLQDNAEQESRMTYMRKLSAEEIAEQKDILSEQSIQKAILLDDLKTIKDEYKAKLEPINNSVSMALRLIRNKSEEVTEMVYCFKDFKANEIGWYNASGELIDSRTMYPNERQKTIFSEIQKTGTNN